MNILLDTHILLWHLMDDPRLNEDKSQIIENTQHNKFLSIASLWEIAIKSSIGKLHIQQSIETIVPQEVTILDIKLPHIQEVQQLPFHHRDPFDRIIIAQAICEKFTIMSDDKYFQHYDIELIR